MTGFCPASAKYRNSELPAIPPPAMNTGVLKTFGLIGNCKFSETFFGYKSPIET
jgi:hypothetical protein